MNDALRLKTAHERRLASFEAFVAAHEAEQGPIAPDQMERGARRARGRAAGLHIDIVPV